MKQSEITIGPETTAKLNAHLTAALDLLAEMNLALQVATEANKNLSSGWNPSSPFQQKIYGLQLRYRELVGGEPQADVEKWQEMEDLEQTQLEAEYGD